MGSGEGLGLGLGSGLGLRATLDKAIISLLRAQAGVYSNPSANPDPRVRVRVRVMNPSANPAPQGCNSCLQVYAQAGVYQSIGALPNVPVLEKMLDAINDASSHLAEIKSSKLQAHIYFGFILAHLKRVESNSSEVARAH